jgi:putative nucleotidyltransferase with HDIG domain
MADTIRVSPGRLAPGQQRRLPVWLPRPRAGVSVRMERHAQKVAGLADAIGRELRLDASVLSDIRLGALLHDVGKAEIPGPVLDKQAPLSNAEWELVRRHPTVGAELVRRVVGRASVAEIVLRHHERWDGSGYPDGLAAERIPTGARVVAVADAFVAMTERRPYRPALRVADALCAIETNSCTQFDPACVEALAVVVERGLPQTSRPAYTLGLVGGKQRSTRDVRQRPSRGAWWDRSDEPPEALLDGLHAVLRACRRLVPEAGSQETPRGRTIRVAVLSGMFIILMWLILAAFLGQT